MSFTVLRLEKGWDGKREGGEQGKSDAAAMRYSNVFLF